MAHDPGMCQLMQQHVIDILPRQLHQEQVEHDILILVAASPTAFQLLDADAVILEIMGFRQTAPVAAAQLFGLGPASARIHRRGRLSGPTGRSRSIQAGS